MRTGLGLGLGLGLLSALRARIALVSVPASLTVGTPAMITGTSDAEGSTVTVTVNGEAWGSAVVSGGAWSVTSTPTAAMAGVGVDVGATVNGVTASGTTTVVHAMSITSLADALYVGVTSEIAGTTTALDGADISVTVNGESFGSTTASGGTWSVSAAPSALMVGSGVDVLATDALGSSASATTTVLTIFAVLDGRYGVTPQEASIASDLTTWADGGTPIDVDPVDAEDWYKLKDDGTGGTTARRIFTSANSQDNHSVALTGEIKQGDGASSSCLVKFDGTNLGYINLATGEWSNVHASVVGTPTTEGNAADGWSYSITSGPVTTNHALQLFPADSDAAPTSTLASGQTALYVRNVAVEQVRALDWADQERSVALDFSQTTASLQPAYDVTEGSLQGDGVDDTLPTTLAQSNYRFLHDGTGCTVGLVFTPRNAASGSLQYIISDDSAAAVGFEISLAATGEVQAVVRGSGGAAAATVALSTVLTDDRKYLVLMTFDSTELAVSTESATGDTESGSDATIGSLDSGDAGYPITLFSNGAAGLNAEINIEQIRIKQGVLTGGDLAAFKAEMKAAAGGFAA